MATTAQTFANAAVAAASTAGTQSNIAVNAAATATTSSAAYAAHILLGDTAAAAIDAANTIAASDAAAAAANAAGAASALAASNLASTIAAAATDFNPFNAIANAAAVATATAAAAAAATAATAATAAAVTAGAAALVVCYVSGTLIRTVKGEVKVEDLRVGDLVITASGEKRPIQWIGHTTTRLLKDDVNRPVCIKSGAFGAGLPYADLYMSPRHSVSVKVSHTDVLIPVMNLVNDITVKQVSMDQVTYWHVELESHDVLIANGLPSESYLDCGNRSFFAKHHGILNLDWENAVPGHHCLPVVESGAMLEQVKVQLQDQISSQDWIQHLNLMIDNEAEVRLAS